jgi:4-amino-4-deoxy-L-arabinose transferase-like glycosyltransferase
LFTLALVNELAAGQKVWLWGAGLLIGALIGLFIAVRNSNASNHPAIETLGWIVAAALGIAIVVALPKHVLYTLLKIAIIALLWSGRRRDRCDHHHSQPN